MRAHAANRHVWGLGALLLITYAYFYQGANWGTAVRYDLVRALAEEGTVCIDSFHENTGDKALWRGRHYCDKAPGGPFLAVPGQWCLVRLPGARGSYAFMIASSYLMVVTAVALPSAVGGMVLLCLLRRLGFADRIALPAVLAWSLGSIAFPYSTVLFGHQTAAAFLVIAFWLASTARRDSCWSWRVFCAGLAGGWAAITEFTCAPVLAALAAYCATRSGRRQFLAFAVGAALPLLVLLVFNAACFDSPLRFGYSTVHGPEFRRAMSEGVLGITRPRPYRLLQLTFGGYRGLFVFCPALFLAIPGYELWRKGGRHRAELALCLGVVAYFLLLISSYYLWAGGWAFGPRHLVPMLPFMAPAVAFALRQWKLLGRILVGASIVLMLAGAAVGPDVPNAVSDPLFEYVLPRFASGTLSINRQSFHDHDPSGTAHPGRQEWNAFNLGELLGLRGLWSLVPLGAIWAGASVVYARRRQRAEGPVSL